MRCLTLFYVLVLCFGLAACGKRPNALEAPEGSTYPRSYPALEATPN